MKKYLVIGVIGMICVSAGEAYASPTAPDETIHWKLQQYAEELRREQTNEQSGGGQSDKEQETQNNQSSYQSAPSSSSGSSSQKTKLDRYGDSLKERRPSPPPSSGSSGYGSGHGSGSHHWFYRRPHHYRQSHRHYYPSYRRSVHIHHYDPVIVYDDSEPFERVERRAPRPMTEEEQAYLNSLWDRYEDRLGNFNITYGLSSDLETNGIRGSQALFRFYTPPVFSHDGRTMGALGFGYGNRTLWEDDFVLANNHFFLEGRLASMGDGNASTFAGRVGLNVVSEENIHAGLGFGLNYTYDNLDSIYSFYVGYDGALYNLNSDQYLTRLESHIESFFRFHLGPLHVDTGGEVTIINLEQDNQFHQFFLRTGVKF